MEQIKSQEKAKILADLRQKIQNMEGFKPESRISKVMFGIPEMDKAFPSGSFPLGVIHEFTSMGYEDTAATDSFSASIVSKIVKAGEPILWITKSREIYPVGLKDFGIEPERIVFVEMPKDKDALWAMEEGLKIRGLSVAICEVTDADLTATRRLQLAVEESGATGFLMRLNPRQIGSSSCFASWQVTSIPSHFENGIPGVGLPRWEVELKKIRNGTPSKWQIEWDGENFCLVKDIPKIIPQEIQSANNVIRFAG